MHHRQRKLSAISGAVKYFSGLMRRRGDVYLVPTALLFVPGTEVAATVAALGEGVDGLSVGTLGFAGVWLTARPRILAAAP
jgi:NADPH:quinone reductase-like Zn-dependent oxidoreductase